MKKNHTKLHLILVTIALLLLSVGSTYAWWTATKTVNQEVSMGNLKLEANFDEQTLTNYEPGTYAEIKGTIKNTGSIPALIRIQNDSTITFAYSDDELTPGSSTEAVDPNVITFETAPQSGAYDDSSDVMWFTHSDGYHYLLVESGATGNISVNVAFDGEKTTNRYMDSVVEAKATIKATQVLEGAIMNQFGIDAADLVPIPATRSRGTSDSQARLLELLARGN